MRRARRKESFSTADKQQNMETKQAYQGFRMLTIVVPLNSPHCTRNRQRNMKMHYLMRRLAYAIGLARNYYRMEAQNEEPLNHGALCLRLMRQFKPAALLDQTWLTAFVEKLQAEELCSCLLAYDDGGVGKATHLCTIPVAPQASLPKAPDISASTLEDGICMDPANVPYFARQGLVLMSQKRVEDIELTDEYYSEWFA